MILYVRISLSGTLSRTRDYKDERRTGDAELQGMRKRAGERGVELELHPT